jgi:hypothetical protein
MSYTQSILLLLSLIEKIDDIRMNNHHLPLDLQNRILKYHLEKACKKEKNEDIYLLYKNLLESIMENTNADYHIINEHSLSNILFRNAVALKHCLGINWGDLYDSRRIVKALH